MKIMAYNITSTTVAVICILAYRILLWAVRTLWHCFRAVFHLTFWVAAVILSVMLYLARTIL